MHAIPVFAALFWALIFLATPTTASACSLYGTRGAAADHVADLTPGTFEGHIVCGNESFQIAVWTMEVDGDAALLGVRDDPLFTPPQANPLTEVAAIGYSTHARFTLFERQSPANPQPGGVRRMFVTLCSDGTMPLDCSFGERRIKMRVDLRDANEDGVLDRAYHQISIYDGADRLQVVYVDLPHDPRPHAMVRQWIRFFSRTGVVDLDRTL